MEKDQKKKTDIVLAQWQTCVEMANSVSQRRDTMNNIFITLNLAIVTAVSVVWNYKSFLVLISGVTVCVLWLFFIRNYKFLNTAKFEVINKLEQGLPEAPFTVEWQELKKNTKYVEGTTLERYLPWTFMLLYFITAIIMILGKCNP